LTHGVEGVEAQLSHRDHTMLCAGKKFKKVCEVIGDFVIFVILTFEVSHLADKVTQVSHLADFEGQNH